MVKGLHTGVKGWKTGVRRRQSNWGERVAREWEGWKKW